MSDPISAFVSSLFSSSALPAVSAPSILGGGLTGASMVTTVPPIIPGLLTSSTPSMFGGLGAMGGASLDFAKNNPALMLGLYDRITDQPQQMQAPQLGLIKPQSASNYQPVLKARILKPTYPRIIV